MYRKKKAKVSEKWSGRMRTNSIIVLIAFIYIGWLSAGDLAHIFASDSWQRTQAVIVRSTVNRGTRGGPDSPWIEFRYHVAGRVFTGDQIDFGQWNYNIPMYLQKYPVGKQILIYYDPLQPKHAVLEKTGSAWANFFSMLLIWGAAAILLYFRFFKRERY